MSSEANEIRAVYLTFPDQGSALAVARQLVERRLAACVNVMPTGTSVYRWRGEVAEEPEAVAIAKTVAVKVDGLMAAVRELHPYELPCVVSYSADGGSPEYLEWVRAEVA